MVSNVGELAQSNFDGAVIGLPTPGSQPQFSALDPSLHDSSQDGSWVFGNASTQIPAWFADDDFDISALNSEILMSTANWILPGTSGQYQNEPERETLRPLVEDTIPSREELVQTHWYTFMGTSRTGQTTPDTCPEPTQVDEAYRASLAVKLQPHMPFLPLPSTDFLVGFYSSPLIPILSQRNRICASKCTLRNSIPCFQSYMRQPSGRLPRAHCCCYPFAPLEACL